MDEYSEHMETTPPIAEGENLPAEVDHAPASSQVLVKAYEQAGSTPVSKEQAAILLAPIDPENDVEIHQLTGVLYVTWMRYVRRLNAAFGPMGWASVRVGQAHIEEGTDQGNKPYLAVEIRVALVVDGRLVRDAVGECRQSSSRLSMAACLEGAMSSGIKRCCKSLGMFDEILDKRWAEDWIATYAERVKGEDGKWQWQRRKSPVKQASPAMRKQEDKTEDKTEGFVRKVEGPTDTGAYWLTFETDEGVVRLLGNTSLKHYPDKTKLLDELVEFTTKTVPQKGGGKMTVLDTLTVKGAL